MTHFKIPMVGVSTDRMSYGILAESLFVYDTGHSHYPTRVVLWSNTSRPNPRNGEPVRYGGYGVIDGGNGRWLDPQHKATDDMLTILFSTESMGISSNTAMNTGQPASGQVYGASSERMRDGDTAELTFGQGGFGSMQVTLHFPAGHNGHGYATFGVDGDN